MEYCSRRKSSKKKSMSEQKLPIEPDNYNIQQRYLEERKPLFKVFSPFWTTLEHFWKSWGKVVFRGWRHPWSHLCHRCRQPLKTTFSKSVWKCSRGVLKWSKPLFKVFLAVLDLLQHFWTVFEGFRLMSCNRAGYGSRSENTPPKNFGRQTWNFFWWYLNTF